MRRISIALFASAAPVLAACTDSPAERAAGPCASLDVLVAASDYASSGVGAFALDGRGSLAFGVDLGTDPMLAVSRGRAFLIARDHDTVFELDPRCGTATSRINVHDTSKQGTANPQDVAVAPDGTLWLPRYNVPSVLVVDAAGAVHGSIDLSPYDPDTNPNASAIRIVDGAGGAKAFVTLERLDDTKNPPEPNLPSQVIRIDVASMKVVATIDLEGRNPFGLVEHGGLFYIAEPGNFSALDEPAAGIERFDPATGTAHLLVRERELGASVAEVAVTSGCGAAIVADATAKNVTSLVTFDPTTGAVVTAAADAVLGPTEGFDLQGLAWKGDVLLVGDRRRTDRGYAVHAFDRTGACTLVARPDVIFLQQKPIALRATD
jgi:hypothetical protein